jgi:hypothetical protein
MTVVGNMLYNCIRPIIIGPSGAGSGATSHPIVVSANHAYSCANPMEVWGILSLKATSTASIGSGVTLSVSQVIGTQSLGLQAPIPSGTAIKFSGGGTITLTSQAVFLAGSLVGNVAGANIATNETATVTVPYSTTGTESLKLITGNADGVSGGTGFAPPPTPQPFKVVTGSYMLLPTDTVLICNGSSLTATLPGPATVPAGTVFVITNINVASTTVATAAGSITSAPTSLAQNATGRYISDGSGVWYPG